MGENVQKCVSVGKCLSCENGSCDGGNTVWASLTEPRGNEHVMTHYDDLHGGSCSTSLRNSLVGRQHTCCSFGAGIRLGRRLEGDMIAVRLAQTHPVVVASPKYLRRNARPVEPGDLQGHQC